ncbi:MAG: DUF5596 domain-containing protein [Clostridiales bacterium]|nr:DUF5596 domain-containing protein [Clostridiales bacterium]
MQSFTKQYDQELSDFFPLMVLAAAAELALKNNTEAGIPEEITVATLKDTNIWIDNFYQSNGRYGLSDSTLLTGHYTGNLFKIGRLQYELIPFSNWGFIFKNSITQELISLSSEKNVSGSGHIAGIYGEEDIAFQASFEQNEDYYEGYVIDNENGIILDRRIKLSKDEWNLILQPGDIVINIHIPQGEKLDYEACLVSIEQAKEFFKKHFPDIKYNAVVCGTWLLDVNLLNILPEESNIIKFMSLFKKMPIYFSVPMIHERVFGFDFDVKDIASAPENTSLQRSLKEYTQKGGKMYNTGGFIID